MKKYISLILILYMTLSFNIMSCSPEKEEKESKEKVKQEEVHKKEEKEKSTAETPSSKEKKEEEKVKLTKEEKDIYKKYLGYPWELLKDKKFKNLYIKALGELGNIPWIRNISAVGGKNKIVSINGKKYVYITFCKPHFCDTEMVYLLFSPDEKKIFGVYLIESDYDFAKIPIGKPSEEELKVLAEAVKKDINSFVNAEVILSAKNLKPEDLGIKKLKPCPILKKVQFTTGNDESVKSITEKIYNKFIKEQDINLEELKKLGLSLEAKDFLIATVNLNSDRAEDLVFIVNSSYMCGTGGCPAFIYINKRNKYKSIDVSVLLQNMDYFYLSKTKTNGYRDLIVNDELILKYNGKKYVVGGRCYVQ